MATTTNFNWETPDDTDLVKDGAAAIRTLANSIDTSFVDLKGGTTGQVLSKASGTDLDFSWVAQDDSNAIQNAIVDAKGDLIAATAADTPARLAVGTNGQVLTADSTAATGLKWATAAASSGPTFAAKDSGNQTVTANTWTKKTLQTELWDTDSCFASSRFTPNKAGYYQINAALYSAGSCFGSIYLNGVDTNAKEITYQNTAGRNTTGSMLFYLNGTTDYLELYLYSSNATVYNGYMDAIWIRS